LSPAPPLDPPELPDAQKQKEQAQAQKNSADYCKHGRDGWDDKHLTESFRLLTV